MRFPWQIINRDKQRQVFQRLRDLDAANNKLHSENVSLRLTIKTKDDKIELLEQKYSRVGISKLENEIVRLNEEVSRLTLQANVQSPASGVQDALVPDTEGTTQLDLGLDESAGHEGKLHGALERPQGSPLLPQQNGAG